MTAKQKPEPETRKVLSLTAVVDYLGFKFDRSKFEVGNGRWMDWASVYNAHEFCLEDVNGDGAPGMTDPGYHYQIGRAIRAAYPDYLDILWVW